jgi:hypothetical protein
LSLGCFNDVGHGRFVRLNEILKARIRNKETKLVDLVGLRSEEMKKSRNR